MSNEIKPVDYQYLFSHPFGGGDVWRNSPSVWNGRFPKDSRPIYDEGALEAAREEEAKKWELKFAASDYKYDQDICELRQKLALATEALEQYVGIDAGSRPAVNALAKIKGEM